MFHFHCLLLLGLGNMGLGQFQAAATNLQAILQLNCNHQVAQISLDVIPMFQQNSLL